MLIGIGLEQDISANASGSALSGSAYAWCQDKIISAWKYLSDRAHLRGYMLDTVQDPSGFIAENDITVLAHDLDDQCLLADVPKFVKMLKLDINNPLQTWL